jgi:hypothetical protein
VEIAGDREGLEHMLPNTAEQFANSILDAVRYARGEGVPTSLDNLLK